MDAQIKKGFSFARMWRFLTADIASDRYELLFKIGVFALVLNLVYMYQLLTPRLFDGRAVSFWVSTLSLMTLVKVVWMIDTGSLFSDYHNKNRVNQSLLLPVSQTEQWWARVLRSLISFVAIYAVMAGTVLGWIWFTGNYDNYIVQFEQFELLGLSFRSIIASIISALFIWGLCIAIAIFFRRNQRLICLFYFILAALPSFILSRMLQVEECYKILNDFTMWSIGLKVVFAFGLIASFYRFKRLQVMN